MKKINSILGLAVAALLLASCGNNLGYKKTKSGLLYKIISTGKDTLVKDGNIIKFNIWFKLERNDSLLKTTVGTMPGYLGVRAPQGETYDINEIVTQLHNGDSVVMVQFLDSMIRKSQMPPQLPPFLKRTDKIITTVKILKVLPNGEVATNDQNDEMKHLVEANQRQAAEDLAAQVPKMQAWLDSSKIAAQKTGTGTFVLVKDPGTGLVADSGKYVTVRYEGRTMDGKIFETNMDPKAEPAIFQLGTNQVIKGWEEGFKLLKQGGKGTFYIPGALAYGRNPRQGSPFKSNEALIFDIVLENVSATPPAPQAQALPPQVREQMEKQAQQQIQKKAHK